MGMPCLNKGFQILFGVGFASGLHGPLTLAQEFKWLDWQREWVGAKGQGLGGVGVDDRLGNSVGPPSLQPALPVLKAPLHPVALIFGPSDLMKTHSLGDLSIPLIGLECTGFTVGVQVENLVLVTKPIQNLCS